MTSCPECSGQLRPMGADFFCLDCDFDTLQSAKHGGMANTAIVYPSPRRRRPRNRTPQWIDTDAEWYMKTQLRKDRKWRSAQTPILLTSLHGKVLLFNNRVFCC